MTFMGHPLQWFALAWEILRKRERGRCIASIRPRQHFPSLTLTRPSGGFLYHLESVFQEISNANFSSYVGELLNHYRYSLLSLTKKAFRDINSVFIAPFQEQAWVFGKFGTHIIPDRHALRLLVHQPVCNVPVVVVDRLVEQACSILILITTV